MMKQVPVLLTAIRTSDATICASVCVQCLLLPCNVGGFSLQSPFQLREAPSPL